MTINLIFNCVLRIYDYIFIFPTMYLGFIKTFIQIYNNIYSGFVTSYSDVQIYNQDMYVYTYLQLYIQDL